MLALILAMLTGCETPETWCHLHEVELEAFAQRQMADPHCEVYFVQSLKGDAPGMRLVGHFSTLTFRGDIRGANFSGSRGGALRMFQGGDGMDLRGLVVANLTMIGQHRGADVQGLDLWSVGLNGDLSGASFDGSTTEERLFVGNGVLHGSSFRGGDFAVPRLQGGSLRETDFTGATLVGAQVDLKGPQSAILVGVDLRESTLRIEDWSGMELRQVDARGATFASGGGGAPRVCRDVLVDDTTRFEYIPEPLAWCPGLTLVATPTEGRP